MTRRPDVRLTVDLGAVVANYRRLVAATPAGRCGAVVKANAYGLGVARVTPALRAAGCRDFFVATMGEALELRAIDAHSLIYMFAGPADADDAATCAERGIIPVINSYPQLLCWQPYREHPMVLHVDTGMMRLGVDWTEFDASRFAKFDVTLVMTHLACADEPDHELNALQIARFAAVAAAMPGVQTSIGNSAGVLNGAGSAGDVGRPGIALYGGNPHAPKQTDNGIEPVVRLEGRVLQVRRVPAGVPVGYGATGVADRNRAIAIVGIGYADGLPRGLSSRGRAFFDGRSLPIVGRVSMDLTAVDVTTTGDGYAVEPGDWLDFLGEHVTVDDVAGLVDTIGYEILTGLNGVEKRYVGGAPG